MFELEKLWKIFRLNFEKKRRRKLQGNDMKHTNFCEIHPDYKNLYILSQILTYLLYLVPI